MIGAYVMVSNPKRSLVKSDGVAKAARRPSGPYSRRCSRVLPSFLQASVTLVFVLTSLTIVSAATFDGRLVANKGGVTMRDGTLVPFSNFLASALRGSHAVVRRITRRAGKTMVASSGIDVDTIVNGSTSGDFQADSPSVAVDPNDPLHVFASANDFRAGIYSETGLYSSLAGQPFTDTLEPYVNVGDVIPNVPNLAFGSSGNPAVGIDLNGNDYLGSIGVGSLGPVTNNNAVLVATSIPQDRGRLVEPYISIVDRQQNAKLDDADSLAVDVAPASPYVDSVYSAFTQFDLSVGGTSPIVAAYARNGVNFSTPVVVSQPAPKICAGNGGCADDQGSAIAVDARGVVYIAYINYDTYPSQILISASHDGGATYGAPVRVAGNVKGVGVPQGFEDQNYPKIAVNRTTGRIYVVWVDQSSRYGSSDISISSSPDGKDGSWSAATHVSVPLLGAFRVYPAISVATTTGMVFVSYYDNANYPHGHSYDYVYRRFSPDLSTGSVTTRLSNAPIFPDTRTYFGDESSSAPTPTGSRAMWTGTSSGLLDIETATLR